MNTLDRPPTGAPKERALGSTAPRGGVASGAWCLEPTQRRRDPETVSRRGPPRAAPRCAGVVDVPFDLTTIIPLP